MITKNYLNLNASMNVNAFALDAYQSQCAGLT
jgi:hypothetical protein